MSTTATHVPMFVITGYTGPNHPIVAGPVVPHTFVLATPILFSCATGPAMFTPGGYRFKDLGLIPEERCFRDMQSLVDAVFARAVTEAWDAGASAERREWMGGKPCP